MARRRSGSRERDTGRIANPRVVSRRSPQVSYPDFNDEWLSRIRETSFREIDLTKIEDRRRWAPSKKFPKKLDGLNARIIVVPEGSPLARHQTYGGRFTLDQVRRKQGFVSSRPGWTNTGWSWGPNNWSPHVRAYTYENVSKRIGFALPWQVIICVRRKRRREVLHAFKRVGKGSGGRSRKRNEYSDVRC